MRRSHYQIYDSIDELYDLYPFEVMDIKRDFPNYHGTVYVFDGHLAEFALYELTEGTFCDMLSFSTQHAKLLDFASVIDWHALTNNILKAGLKNVVDHGDVIYVLVDMDA